MGSSKLIVASARLPVALSRAGDEPGAGWQVQASPGGLATALRAVANDRDFTWIGWPGTHVPAGEHDAVRNQLREHGGVAPVFISEEEHEGFYEHSSNRVLWPLFHNLGQPLEFSQRAWDDYQAVNQRFADAILEVARPGDLVWVHDYQLALVPRMLRRRGLEAAVGYFLHIPFPSSETYRTLPVREAVLRGILGADLIGFHAYEYVSHFRSAALQVLGVESDPEGLNMPSHRAHLEVLPIGIDPGWIEEAKKRPEVRAEYDELARRYQGKKVIVGVDRLDYTKGIPQKLLAFQSLLERHPEHRDQVVMIQVAAPSRMGVEEYKTLKKECDELVGRIGGHYATLDSSPLVYINQFVPRERLTALYQLADVALITPVRDGMNLVCLEYLVSHADEPGALILSEFAGAATCLSGAQLVNPHHPDLVAEVLHEALTRPPSEEAWKHMTEFARKNSSMRWAARFIEHLEQLSSSPPHRVRRLRLDVDEQTLERATGAKKPLILLDYDGTLHPHTSVPEDAIPTDEARAMLARLAKIASVYVISGRQASFLDQHLGELPVGLVCEHGLATKLMGESWSERAGLDTQVIDEQVQPLFDAFTDRTPGTRIERKAASIAWHYRNADPKFGAWRAKELRSLLESALAGQPYTVLWGSRVVEVRHVEITKGHATRTLLEHHPNADFVFCAGNDRTDEDMFEALVESGRGPLLTCFVGGVNTSAEFFVERTEDLMRQLGILADLWETRLPSS